MTILSTQERKYETKTFSKNFAKKVRTSRLPFPGNAKLKLSIWYYKREIDNQMIKLITNFPFVMQND
jgi:hypothetical protein